MCADAEPSLFLTSNSKLESSVFLILEFFVFSLCFPAWSGTLSVCIVGHMSTGSVRCVSWPLNQNYMAVL